MAHANFRLVLLRSRPDTVRGITLHKTLLSTFLTMRVPSINDVEKGVQLCYSGFQIQGAANSPPTRSLYIILHFIKDCNRFYLVFLYDSIKSVEDFVKNTLSCLSLVRNMLTKEVGKGIIIKKIKEKVYV